MERYALVNERLSLPTELIMRIVHDTIASSVHQMFVMKSADEKDQNELYRWHQRVIIVLSGVNRTFRKVVAKLVERAFNINLAQKG